MSTIIPPDAVPLKHCSSCPEGQQWYPATLDYFYSDRSRKDGLCHRCKECQKKVRKRHYTEHPEYYQKYAQEHAEQINTHTRKYQQTHVEQTKHARKRYKTTHTEQINTHTRNRQNRRKGAPGTYTLQEIQEQYQRQRGRCYYCSKKLAWGEHHIDHIVPISRGGRNDIHNIVIACPHCNLTKSDKLLSEWGDGEKLL